MKRMKCITCVILALLMLLSLAACSQNNDQDSGGQTSLTAAAEKLKTATSYRLVMTMDNKAVLEQNGVRQEIQAVSTLTCLLNRNAEGTTITAEEKSTSISEGQTNERTGDLYYFSGKEAYICDSRITSAVTNKWVSDKAFDMAFVMDEAANMPIDIIDFAVLKKIEQLSPAKKTDADGTVSYELKDMSAKDFAAVYAMLGGDMNAEEIEQALAGDCKLHITVKVNKDGYMTQFRLDMLNVTAGSNSQDMIIIFAIDQINQIPNIAEPDFVKSFALVDGMEYIQIVDGKQMQYCYGSEYVETPGFEFEGFTGRYDDEYTVDCYEVPSQLEGKPVTQINDIVWNGNITVERLIIPVGVKLDLYESFEETTLFFMDKQENVEKNFSTVGEQDPNARCVVKAAYYEGQWEMVDGIPTPKN